MIDLTKWKVGQLFTQDDIDLLKDTEYENATYGNFESGKFFFVVADKMNHVLSFVLNDWATEKMYKLIWKG